MVDNNSSNERGENSEGEQIPTDLVFRLERKIAELEEEVAHMRDLAKLSISLGTHFGENADNPPLSNQTTLPNNPPINITRPEPTHPNILHAQNTQIPFYHYHQQTKPTVPEPIPNASPPYNPGSNNLNPIYVETAPMTHNYHESESSQKDILIKNLTEKLDSLANRVQNVEGSKRLGGRGHLDGEMYHTVELVGNIEVQPWFSQKIIDMMAWFGFMSGIIDGLQEDLKGLSLIKEEGEGCNVVINEEERGDPRRSNEAKISTSIWTSTPSRPRRASG
ncbi:hypothetical protein R3W88_031346 [Solanum pinnatisectum]|uniref:Uncharacterized protein n=1 Tax=Solanum pinnatisectum TaxID=50273 RepID=A0AAV9LL42_9SOLN|nr:hypothetical protein R3W88_031346 [Solanum pinnatisectum]